MKLYTSATLMVYLVLGGTLYSQNQSDGTTAPAQRSAQEESRAPQVTVTGCLTKGTGANEYVVLDQKSNEKVPFTGPAQLDSYVNQTVKMTGTMAGSGAQPVFKPVSVNRVAPDCQKPQQ